MSWALLSCSKSQGRHPLHTAINELIQGSLATAGVPAHAQLEPSGICQSDGKRPDGATVAPWRCGRAFVWDATCPDTFSASHVMLAASEAGARCRDGEHVSRVSLHDAGECQPGLLSMEWYPSLFLKFFHQLIFPCRHTCSLETLGTIPTSLLVFVENVFTSLVSLLFMECKLHSGNLSLKPWRRVMQVTCNFVLKARTVAVPRGLHA